MLFSILCNMGLPAIDESLARLLTFLDSNDFAVGSFTQLAKAVGCMIALCVGGYECWMMMLGRRGMDVMKILKIIGFSICITSSGWICGMLKAPGKALETAALDRANVANAEIRNKEQQVATLQADYLRRIRTIQDSLSNAQRVQEIGEDPGVMEEIRYSIEHMGETISNLLKRAAIWSETKITEWINEIIRFIGQLIFQMTYYGILLAQRIFLAIMGAVCPLMFAMSLAPPFANAWSQWLGKFVSLSLWGWVTYICIFYIDALMMYNLDADATVYTNLINGAQGTWSEVGALGMQGIGSNCMYVMAMLVGAKVISMVPEVSSWLIPGGVSSGAGGAVGGMVATGASLGAGYAVTAMSAGRAAVGAIGTAGTRNTSFESKKSVVARNSLNAQYNQIVANSSKIK